MKIGIVCPYDMFRGGGVQKVVRAEYAELTSQGHSVKIITPKPYKYEGEVPEYMILMGASADFRSPFATTSQVSSRVDDEFIDKTLKQEAFDVLHFHEPWVPMLSRQLLMRSRACNIATFHAKLPETVMSRTIERVVTPYTRSIIKYLHGMTAVSDAAANYVRTLTSKHIEIIPNGIELEKYRNASVSGNSDGKRTILFVGRLEKRKGVKFLIKAFQVLIETTPRVKLVIAGDGPDREKLEAQIAEEHLKSVEFKGYVSDTEKLKLLKNASLFCSPALYGESFGIVLLEAMAAGIVTVAGDNPGYCSVMTGSGQMSIVNPKDTAEFARRLKMLLDDEPLREFWNEWAADEISKYDHSHVIKLYESYFKKTLAQK